MHRVALLLELAGDEADQVIAAIAATEVRFAGLTLREVIDMSLEVGPRLPPDATIAHDVVSDSILYEGGSKFRIVAR